MELDEVRNKIRRIAHWLDVDLELPMMYEYITKLPPGAVYVEIGTFMGASAIAMALSAPEGVEIHTIDDGSMPLSKGHTLEQYEEKVYAFMDQYGVRDRIDFYIADARQMRWTKGIDMLYVDGNHSTPSVAADAKAWCPRVNDGGVAIFHDATTHKSVKAALDATMRSWKLWKELEPAGSMCRFERLGWTTQS